MCKQLLKSLLSTILNRRRREIAGSRDNSIFGFLRNRQAAAPFPPTGHEGSAAPRRPRPRRPHVGEALTCMRVPGRRALRSAFPRARWSSARSLENSPRSPWRIVESGRPAGNPRPDFWPTLASSLPQGPRAVPTSPSVPHSQGRPVAHPVDCPHEGRLKPVPPSSATAVLPAGLPASAPNPNTPSSPQQPEGSVRARSDPGSPCFKSSMASRGTENQTRVPPRVLQDSPPLPDATVPVTPPQAQWPVPPPPPQ